MDPTNPTNLVLRQDRPAGAQVTAGTNLGATGLENPIPFVVGSTIMNARVWSPDSGTPILLRVENSLNSLLSVETYAYTTNASTWETLHFDFTNNVIEQFLALYAPNI